MLEPISHDSWRLRLNDANILDYEDINSFLGMAATWNLVTSTILKIAENIINIDKVINFECP